MTIIVFGSVNVDLVAYVDTLPRPGLTSHALRHAVTLGGKGANQAVAAQRLSADSVRFVAAVGQDHFGKLAQEYLNQYGVSTEHLIITPEAGTGLALIHVDAASQNSITVIGGANMVWGDDGPEPHLFENTTVALFQLETPIAATLSAMRAARASGARIVLDPAPVPHADIGPLLAEADIVTPNEFEVQLLTGRAPVDGAAALSAAQDLLHSGCGSVVLKLGAKGLVYASRSGESGVISAFEVKIVDTVAAGDCFNGGLAVALAEGRNLRDALLFASAAGALATTKPGAADAAPHRALVDILIAGGKL
jgi:ribokinase